MIALASLVLALAASPSGWQDARTIAIPSAALPAYVRLTLPQSIDGGPDGAYPSLRVADGGNREVPYALDADPARGAGGPATLTDVGFVPGRYTQAVADLGTSGALHSAITLESSRPTFFEHVEIATSDDRHTWAVLVRDALIYRVAENGDRGQTTVAYGPSRARWVRVRILDGSHAFALTGASVPAEAPAPALVPLAGTQTLQQAGSKTVVTIDLGTPNTDVEAVAFESTTLEFVRSVAFETNDDGGGPDAKWKELAGASVARYAGARYAATQLTALTGSVRARLLRVTIDNQSDPPLAGLRVTVLGAQHHVIFRAQPGAQYRLLWGNADAAAPGYDLAERLRHEAWSVGAVATLGAAASTDFTPASAGEQTPWLQRAGLPIALALLCVVLLAVVLAAMRTKPAA